MMTAKQKVGFVITELVAVALIVVAQLDVITIDQGEIEVGLTALGVVLAAAGIPFSRNKVKEKLKRGN